MSKAKRASIKGKGVDIFLGEEHSKVDIPEKHNAIKPAGKLTVMPVNQVKATYFINSLIADRLEDIWLSLRKKFKNKKISKSRITEIALDNLIKDWEKNQDSSLIEVLLTGKKER